jgi:protein ImuA
LGGGAPRERWDARLHLAPPPPATSTEAAFRKWHPGLGHDIHHTELVASADEASGAALALALALDMAEQGTDYRPWLWVQDKAAIRLSGRPYRPGLPEGLRHRLIHVAADKPADALFALEEGLRCCDLAFVIGELAGNPAALDFTASRRLSLVAQRHGVPLWLVRLSAQHDLGSARMRWDVAAAPSPPPRWNADAPGDPRWRADLFRAHVFQPGQWILGDDSERPGLAVFTPDHGGMVPGAGDRSLASVQPAA